MNKRMKKKSIEIQPDVLIARTSNGFIIQTPSNGEEYDYETEVISFAEHDKDSNVLASPMTTLDELKSLRDLLWTVMEGLGYNYSDHNSHNVVPTIENQKTGKRTSNDWEEEDDEKEKKK